MNTTIPQGTGSITQNHNNNPRENDPVPTFEFKKGPKREYLVSQPNNRLDKLRSITTLQERLTVLSLALFTAVVRLYNLQYPDSVVFDEVHFGGFASLYIKRIFFMDVHPPLAKMLFAAVSYLCGFKGDFQFDSIGDKFPSNTPYLAMRLFSSILGSLTVLLMYLTLRYSGVSMFVCLLITSAFVLENSFVTISRYILLDSPLIFFIALTVYSYKKFELYPIDTWKSYKALLSTGIALGLAISSKWVGAFTLAWIGLLSICKIWFSIGDLSLKPSKIIKLILAKLVCLLIIPFIIYCMAFKIHFDTLTISGDGAGFMSSSFRSTLSNSNIPSDILKDVGISSVVTIRHVGTMGGYLHSHPHLLETGSKQQQVTLYPHLDDNNKWIIELASNPGVTVPNFESLKDGAHIRLLHPLTYCRLHSHDFPAPVSEFSDWQTEVSCYGAHGFDGDINDTWVVEIDQDATRDPDAKQRVVALKTIFRLKHLVTGCYLFSHEVRLPKWGFEQQEVTCATQGKFHLTQWYVEDNENMNLDELTSPRVSYEKPSFWSKFIESHQRMWHINNNLVESHIYSSYPSSWPFLSRGISYWGQENRRVYLLGNAIMWWSVSLFALVSIGIFVVELVSWQLGVANIFKDPHIINFNLQTFHYLLGFTVHFIPSFLMKRQLFLHHYLPAYYFGILALASGFNLAVTYFNKRTKMIGILALIIFTGGCVYFFNTYKPLIYGLPWTKNECMKSKWLPNWDYDCNIFLNSYEDYKNTTISTST